MQEAVNLRTIGKYQILGPLGRGAMGLVYKARDPEIGRVVAIKTLRRMLTAEPKAADAAIKRFQFEARSAGNLRHPNIITIFEVNRDGDMPYIVMDYVEGESLDVIIKKTTERNPQLTIQYLSQLAAALDYAHSRGVVHRDIKPSNILVDKAGTVFILDFGIASINESYPGAENSSGTAAPVMGTPGYMSPEQILNEKIDYRTDLFSLAVVAFESFTGQKPFLGENFTELVGKILNSKPQSLTALAPECPLALEAEFERALAKSKEQRFASAQEMVAHFAKAIGVEIVGSSSRNDASNLPRERKSSWRTVKGSSSSNPKVNLTSGSQIIPMGSGAPAISGKESLSSQWGMVQGVRSGEHGSSGSYATSQSRGHNPGQSMFKEENRSLDGVRILRERVSLARRLAGGMGILSVGLGIFLLWNYFTSPQNAGAPGSTQIVHGTALLNNTHVQTNSYEAMDDIELRRPQVESFDSQKNVEEMNDRQLLGVMMSHDAPEDLVLNALRMGKQRKIANLVEASVFTLQSDSYVIRIATLKMLAEIGDRRVVPYVVMNLDDHDPLVRGHAARTLGALGDRRALGYLSSRLLKEDSTEVKGIIKKSIEKINGFPMRE